MNILPKAAALATLFAAAPVFAQDLPAPSRDTIGWGTMGAWGSGWRNVSIDRDGRVVISSFQGTPPPEPCQPTAAGNAPKCPPARKGISTIRYSIGPDGFVQIRAILAPLERAAARPRGKICEMFDADYAHVGWKIGGRDTSYALGIACGARENQRADAIANAAEQRLTALGAAATDRSEMAE